MQEVHKRAIRSVVLALQGGFILLGGALLFTLSPISVRLDGWFGSDGAVAAIVFGAILILAFRTPTRTWVNIAILYEALAILSWAYNYFSSLGTHLGIVVPVISAIFLILLGLTYPSASEVAAAA
jgi:hypothetical protein